MTTDRFDVAAPVPAAADLGRVHFIAIGGAGMSGSPGSCPPPGCR